MKKTLYDYSDYKSFLRNEIAGQPGGGHGYRSKLARAAGCQLAYLTRVLGGDAHLSAEQAHAISKFLGHDESDQKYFILLLQYARAGNAGLRELFKIQLAEARAKRLNLRERFQVKAKLSLEDQARYYSHWYYVAIHVLVSISGFQTKIEICRRLNLAMSTVSKALDFLESTGLVELAGSRYKIGVTRIHVGTDSPHLARHHANWRIRAIQSLDDTEETVGDNLHYSSVISVSREDAEKIKFMLAGAIDEYNATVRDSKDEDLRCLCVDFFSVR